jgi:hypothetical protein
MSEISRKDELSQIIRQATEELNVIEKAESMEIESAINSASTKGCFKEETFDGQYRVEFYAIVIRAERGNLYGHQFYRTPENKIVINIDVRLPLTFYGYQSGHGKVTREEFDAAWSEIYGAIIGTGF